MDIYHEMMLLAQEILRNCAHLDILLAPVRLQPGDVVCWENIETRPVYFRVVSAFKGEIIPIPKPARLPLPSQVLRRDGGTIICVYREGAK